MGRRFSWCRKEQEPRDRGRLTIPNLVLGLYASVAHIFKLEVYIQTIWREPITPFSLWRRYARGRIERKSCATVASVSIHSAPEFLTCLHGANSECAVIHQNCDSGAHLDPLCGMRNRTKALHTPALERPHLERILGIRVSGEQGAVGSKSITATEEADEKCNTARHGTVMRNSCSDPCICRKLLLFWLGMHGDARLLTNWEVFLHLPYKSCGCTHGLGRA